MKLGFGQGLAIIGIAVPLVLLGLGMPTWAAGLALGEFAGLISYVWVGLSVRRAFSSGTSNARRSFLFQSLVRYIVIGTLFVFAIKWPGVEIIGVVIGYSIIQIPAAILRALSQN
jgi:ATP synthase I chain